MCWIGAARKRVGELAEERLAGGAVVGEDPHLDQPVGVEGGLDLAPARRRSRRRRRWRRPGRGDGLRRAFACARRQSGGGRSRAYYRRPMTARSKEQEAEQGVAARPPDRSLRQAGAARGLSRPRRLQAEGDRRAAAPARARPAGGRPRRGAGRLEPVRAAQVRPRREQRPGGAGRAAERHDHRPRHARVRADRGRRLHRRRLPRGRGPGRARSARRPAGRSTSSSRTWRPNLSGIAASDAARMADLVELAVDFARRHLRPNGALVCKVFHGSGYSQLVERFKASFRDRQADQAEGVAGQVGRDLSGRHRPQAGCIRRRYPGVAVKCPRQ